MTVAEIPRVILDEYTSQLNKLSEVTRKILLEQLGNTDFKDIADLRDKVIEIAEPIIEAAADNSAALAADFYDNIRTEAIGKPLGAIADSMWDPKALQGSVKALVQSVVEGAAVKTFYDSITERADYTIKKSAGDCVAKNSARDKKNKGYARVPTGAETCEFCIMLASRGFVYHTKEDAGAVNHYHANCDCRVVPGFQGMEVEGYDTGALYDRYLKFADKFEYDPEKKRVVRVKENSDNNSGEKKVFNDGNAKFGVGDAIDYIQGSKTAEEVDRRLAEVIKDMDNHWIEGTRNANKSYITNYIAETKRKQLEK